MYQPTDEVTWHSLLEFCHTHIGCLDTEHRAWRLDHEIELSADGRPQRPDLPPTFAAFLDDRQRFGIHAGLDNMSALVERLGLGDVLRRTPTILVGGTNGKGTVATAIADALATVHHRPGLYTSPHVERFLERIQISGSDPDRTTLTQACDVVQEAVAALDDDGIHPTYFETATALAFVVFQRIGASPWVLEVGLGGRGDATNVAHPVATVITNVGSDHADRLGPTVEQRAYEKAGIMRPGVPCFTAAQGAALRALRFEATRSSVPLVPVLPTSPVVDAETANLALVRATLGNGPVRRRLRNTTRLDPLTIRLPAMPGRYETFELAGDRRVVLDVAHNTEALDALAGRWSSRPHRRQGRAYALVGRLEDKETTAWPALLRSGFTAVTVTTPASARAVPAEAFAQELVAMGAAIAPAEGPAAAALVDDSWGPPSLHVVDDPAEALQTALARLEPGDTLLVTGSFYLVAVVRPILEALRRHAA